MKTSLIILAILLLGACGRNTTEFVITGRGADRPDPICQNFQLTPAQARTFFEKARPITGEELHGFDYMPCWVSGKKIAPDGISTWTIHPIGVAKVTLPNGQLQMLGCKSCDELFQ